MAKPSAVVRPSVMSVSRASALQAELYALTHRGTPGDVRFYREFCRGAKSVLELGCGAGRLLGELPAPGRRLVGLDRDAGLLALARKRLPRGVELVAADMRAFDLGERFDRVLVPYSGFYCLLTRKDALSCLRSIRRHLAPHGKLALDAYAADAFHEDSSADDLPDDALGEVVAFEHRGKIWDVYEKSRWSRRRQRLDVTYVYAARRSRSRVEIALPQRYLRGVELGPLLERAGLRLTQLHGGFRDERYRARSSEHLVVVARAARET